MPVFSDLLGRTIPHGVVAHQREWLMHDDSALPSWLTVSGTPAPTVAFNTIAGGAGDRGSVRVTTGTALNDFAVMTGPTIADSTKFRAIYFTLYGLTFNQFQASSLIQFGIDNVPSTSTAGAYFEQLDTVATDWANRNTRARLCGSGTNAAAAISTARYDLRSTQRRNLCIAIYPAWKAVALMYDRTSPGTLIYLNDNDANFVNGSIAPRIRIDNKLSSGFSRWFEFSGAELLLETS